MAYEMKDNSGSLFANDRREKETHPNAKGTAMIDGREYWVDAWTNTASNGKKYQSLKFKLKEQSADQAHRASLNRGEVKQGYDDLDDEVPF
jgi:hypothetical protein